MSSHATLSCQNVSPSDPPKDLYLSHIVTQQIILISQIIILWTESDF